MKVSLLPNGVEKTKKQIQTHKNLCIVLSCICVAINVILAIVSTPKTIATLLFVNAVLDVAVAWFVLATFDCIVRPLAKICNLVLIPHENLAGLVEAVSEQTMKIRGFDCYVASIGERKVYVLKDCSIKLAVGQRVNLVLSSNVVVEVSYE